MFEFLQLNHLHRAILRGCRISLRHRRPWVVRVDAGTDRVNCHL